MHRRYGSRVGAPRRITAALAALAMALVGLVAVAAEPARAATKCSDVWYTIEVGSSGRFVRPRSDGLNASLYGTGTAAEPWNNFFLLCRDPAWDPGDYALFANLGRHYLKVNDTYDLIMGSDGIKDSLNLLRIRNYDGNFQTLWGPDPGIMFYVGPVSPAGQLAASTYKGSLNGTNLYRVRSVEATPRVPDIPNDPRGTLPCPCQPDD